MVSTVTTATGRTVPFSVYRDTGDIAVSDDGRYVALVTANRVTTNFPSQTWSTGLAHRVDTVTGAVVPLGSGQTTTWEHQVELDPTGRYAYYYAHLERYADGVKEGMDLKRGDVLGYVGVTGNSDPNAPHLHFSVVELTAEKQGWKGTPRNPDPMMAD